MINSKSTDNNLSAEQIKKNLSSQIADCTQLYTVDIKILFVWLFKPVVGTITKNASNQYILKVNLSVFIFCNWFKSDINIKILQEYLSRYIIEYFILICNTSNHSPESYSEGLAALDIVYSLSNLKTISMNMPLLVEIRLFQCRKLFPADIYCSAAALDSLLKDMSISDKHITQRQLKLIHTISILPEIVYNGSKTPSYSSIYIIRKIMALQKNKISTVACSFYDHYIGRVLSMTIHDLYEDFLNDKNPFSGGLALRLITLLSNTEREQILSTKSSQQFFEVTAADFNNSAVNYIKLCNESDCKLFSDNAIAVQRIVNQINDIADKYNLKITSGSVYSPFC